MIRREAEKIVSDCHHRLEVNWNFDYVNDQGEIVYTKKQYAEAFDRVNGIQKGRRGPKPQQDYVLVERIAIHKSKRVASEKLAAEVADAYKEITGLTISVDNKRFRDAIAEAFDAQNNTGSDQKPAK